ncbi:MAG: hypothetical protein JEY97_12075 [Bacteroidales bacterium]|nr:hypothetical protein [Bacteroidales bacterium]
MKKFYTATIVIIALLISQQVFSQQKDTKDSSKGEQQIELPEAYSFISSHIIAENPDMLIVMASVLLNENLDFVRDSEGNMLRKIGPNWINGIGNWTVDQGYLVRMLSEDSFTIIGNAIDPVSPIQLETGYQFISYFPETSLDALISFETIIGENLDFVRDSEGNMLRKIGPNWVNGIGDCNPGEGYLVKMNSDAELIYPAINQAPEPPSSPNPEDGAINQSTEADISWICSDPEGDPLTYDIYFGTEAIPPLIASGQTETTYDPGTLDYNTEYFWKIIAHDDHSNTSEGNVWSFTTEEEVQWQCGDPFTDPRDGQNYNTVLITNQCWMAENINIGQIINGNNSQGDNGVIEKYCYDNDPANCETYGGLYQWQEMMQYETTQGVQGICPENWHIATDNEWKTLEGTVDSQYPVGNSVWNNTGWRGYDAGKKLKSLTNWYQNSGTDLYDFTILPAGYRCEDGSFDHITTHAHFWLSSSYNNSLKWYRQLKYDENGLLRYYIGRNNGFSVRCLHD